MLVIDHLDILAVLNLILNTITITMLAIHMHHQEARHAISKTEINVTNP